MTARQRLFAVLSGKPVDRLPIWLLFPYHTTGYYVDVRTNPCYVPIFEKSKQCAIMLDRRNLALALFAPEVTCGRGEVRAGRLEGRSPDALLRTAGNWSARPARGAMSGSSSSFWRARRTSTRC